MFVSLAEFVPRVFFRPYLAKCMGRKIECLAMPALGHQGEQRRPSNTRERYFPRKCLEARSLRRANQIHCLHLTQACKQAAFHIDHVKGGNDTGLQVMQSFLPHVCCGLKLPSTAFSIAREMDCFPLLSSLVNTCGLVVVNPQRLPNRKTIHDSSEVGSQLEL